ncbi:TRAP transporter large permease [Muricoccus pecuniae]|uniref:TRAP transporter large permease protein n=1 Tax=Muricoccus pecuniae TaxID=693023 RepID=A0A840Y6P8_9PROT|nr:TRAP transporter large permease [Roseomonas pecuniae]MBB5696415.1 tripartite ATP-independent transporter DctM subunit [Roseomonas pecuniae]
MLGYLVIAGFMALFIAGFPIVYAILIPCIGYVLIEDLPLTLLAQRVTYALDSFPLVAVPLFIFVGNLMNLSGITDRIFNFADTLFSRIHGGLAQVNILGSLIFSGISGAALADIAGLGRVEIKAMRERGFDAPFAAAVTASSSLLGPIFPPSIPLIVYGSATSVSVVQLLLGGILPAVVCTIFLMIAAGIVSVRAGYPRAPRWPTLREAWEATLPAFPALMAPVLIILGMLMGVFTPTEAAAVAVLYVLFVGFVVHREMTWQHVLVSALLTARNTAAILVIVAAAAMLGWILSVEQIPQEFSAFVTGLSNDPLTLLVLANVIFLLAGMFLDSTTATLLIVPIVAPPLVAAGVDPVHLGLVVVFNLMIGLLTPPMGLALFLMADIAEVSMRQLLRALVPFYIPLIVTQVVITVWPEVVLAIPRMIR